MPMTASTATASSSRCPEPPRAWSISPGTATAAWGGTRSSVRCSTWGSSSTRPLAAAGQLLMIAGSHRGTSRLPLPREAAGLPVAPLSTEPGDVTVHFGHTLHAAPPPTDPSASGRRALYLTFVPPITFDMVGPGQGYNDVLFARDEGRVHHVDQLR